MCLDLQSKESDLMSVLTEYTNVSMNMIHHMQDSDQYLRMSYKLKCNLRKAVGSRYTVLNYSNITVSLFQAWRYMKSPQQWSIDDHIPVYTRPWRKLFKKQFWMVNIYNAEKIGPFDDYNFMMSIIRVMNS
jgi:hypothetical protein